jgi:hypothetical protein
MFFYVKNRSPERELISHVNLKQSGTLALIQNYEITVILLIAKIAKFGLAI